MTVDVTAQEGLNMISGKVPDVEDDGLSKIFCIPIFFQTLLFLSYLSGLPQK